jgi:hypothetical protein
MAEIWLNVPKVAEKGPKKISSDILYFTVMTNTRRQRQYSIFISNCGFSWILHWFFLWNWTNFSQIGQTFFLYTGRKTILGPGNTGDREPVFVRNLGYTGNYHTMVCILYSTYMYDSVCDAWFMFRIMFWNISFCVVMWYDRIVMNRYMMNRYVTTRLRTPRRSVTDLTIWQIRYVWRRYITFVFQFLISHLPAEKRAVANPHRWLCLLYIYIYIYIHYTLRPFIILKCVNREKSLQHSKLFQQMMLMATFYHI